ncbi:MAG: methionine--tRNA ligase subunit beta, partial [Campylobacterota bacterium]|nr:methionine--tRNA ligase subunit beta [Campylobacterota bacterium]
GDYEPWAMMKDGREEQAMALVSLITNIMAKVSLLLDSVMPEKISKIAQSLGITIDNANYIKLIQEKKLIGDTVITKIDALFPRIEEELIATAEVQKAETVVEKPRKEAKVQDKKEEEPDNLITIDKFFETTLKIGTIVEAVEVPKSKKLLKLQVDVGEENPRQILAGIKEFYSAESLVGTQACVVANLKPAKLMGMLSEGMLLAAKDENGLHLLRPEASKTAGTKVS